jgi:hypothetical protein
LRDTLEFRTVEAQEAKKYSQQIGIKFEDAAQHIELLEQQINDRMNIYCFN